MSNKEEVEENLELTKSMDDEKSTESQLIMQKSMDELKSQLENEQKKVESLEKKIQYLLGDFDNLKKRSEIDIQNKVSTITDGIVLKFLSIYDDFIRAQEALSKQGVDVKGLNAILKNMDSFLSEYDAKPIDCVGDIFNPKLHEAMAIKIDPSLDDNTITAELRKGYILKDRVIRPSIVEISKKQNKETDTNG